MEYQCLKICCEGEVCTLAVSVPKSLNALNSQVLSELDHFLDHFPQSVSVLIVTGDGTKSFVAGADIAEMKDKHPAEALSFAQLGSGVFRKIKSLPIPVIAAVNGFALGGGCELAMACDIRIASTNAKFGQPEVKLGIIPGFSGTVRLSRLVGPSVAKELIFTGRNIDAAEALRIGLVNSVCEPEELMASAKKMAGKIAACGPVAIRAAKRCINAEWDMSVNDAIAFENEAFAGLFATEDQKEGMTAFLEKRPAIFKNK